MAEPHGRRPSKQLLPAEFTYPERLKLDFSNNTDKSGWKMESDALCI